MTGRQVESTNHLHNRIRPKRIDRGQIALEFGLSLGLLGALASAGWMLNVAVIKSLFPEVTALGLLLCGVGLSLLSFQQVSVKDGRTCHVSTKAPDVRDSAENLAGSAQIARDITEHRHSEAGRLDGEERFRLFAENIGEAFWIATADQAEMLYVSPAYEKIWGRSCQSLYESPSSFIETIHWEDRAHTQAAFEAMRRGENFDFEHRIICPAGQVRWIRTRGAAIRNEEGAVCRVAGIAEDITRQKETEQQLRHAQKMETIGKLAGGVAHDFSNVLSVIGANLELLLAAEKNLSPEARDYLEHIARATTVSVTLNRQLLMFSRNEAVQMQILDLNGLVSDFTKMLRRIVGEDIVVQNNLMAGLAAIKADPGMIEQVLMNLAVNSRDAMPNGGQLVISTEEAMVDEARARTDPRMRAGRHVCLSVRDTGNGIAPEIMPRIFEAFFTTKSVGKGTGLGLATVFGIVEQHKGWVEASSAFGAGATFRVYLPVASENLPASTLTGSQEPAGGAEKVMWVEDDSSLRTAVIQILQNYGYAVFAADSGISAQKLWAEHNGSFDLLLTDMVLPGGMTGLELAEKLRYKKPELKNNFDKRFQ